MCGLIRPVIPLSSTVLPAGSGESRGNLQRNRNAQTVPEEQVTGLGLLNALSGVAERLLYGGGCGDRRVRSEQHGGVQGQRGGAPIPAGAYSGGMRGGPRCLSFSLLEERAQKDPTRRG